MSIGGGLWFVVCIPTQDYERERLEPPGYGLKASDPPSNAPPDYETSVVNQALEDETTDVKLPVSTSLEQVLRKTLEELRIFDALWVLDETEKYYKVTFPCCSGLRCDLVLTTLSTNGIGMCKGSSLGIVPCTVLLQDDDFCLDKSDFETVKLLSEDKKSDSDSSTLSKTKSDIKKAFKGFKEMQKKFLQTVTARLTVAQVVEGVRAGSELSFDFIMFVIIASMIAALGLLENSSVVIVASMLISPIMGPIMAGTFGAVIRDKSLRNQGIKAEVIGLLLCVAFGFFFGLAGASLNNLYGKREWPTPEMISRGQDRSLWIGILIALPSGVGVALSVLGGNAGCLVGVAISASLLPPAVNAGLLWGLAAIRKIKADDEQLRFVQLGGVTRLMKPSLTPSETYEILYFEEMDKECAMLGLVSLGLALLNIACIFIAAVVVLKIKEVAPHTSFSKTSRFWKEDIKIAREYNKAMPPSEPEDLGNQFIAEWATLNGLEAADVLSDDEEATMTRLETLKDIIHDVEADEVFQTITQSVVNKKDTRPLSQRLSVHPSSHNVDPRDVEENGTHVLTKGRESHVKSWIPSPIDGDTNGDLNKVQLRHGRKSRPSPTACRDSVAILRQSLANAPNPYTLWPSAVLKPDLDRRSRYRSTINPVAEESSVAVPVFQRLSRFLQYPEVVVKETTC